MLRSSGAWFETPKASMMATTKIRQFPKRCSGVALEVQYALYWHIHDCGRNGRGRICRMQRSFRDYGLTPSGDSFMLACAPPCKAVTQFDRATLRPYFGSPEALERGYADIRECQQLRESTQF
jgi:hypothetical protein